MLFNAAPDDDGPAETDEQIVREAVERYLAVKEFQSVNDEWTREDIKFANGDARNNWQWPNRVYEERTDDENDLPCLTVNITRTHNDMIINSMSKTQYGVKIRPTGGKASYKSAEAMETLIKRTQYISNATTHFRKVAEHQVDGGIGYILIDTDYVSNRSKNQDIYLKAANDPTAVYLDIWARQPDGLDANWGHVFEKLPRKEFNRKYPQWKDKVGASPLDNQMGEWLSDKEIVLAKYFRKNQTKDTLVWWTDANGDEIEKLTSEIKEESGSEIYDQLMEDIKEGKIDGDSREVFNDEVEWFLIAGNTIVEKGIWAGKYIPILRCVGRELVIDGTLDRKGHTRPLISPQQMLNWHASTAVEYAASATKAQWTAPAEAMEGQEQWKTMNRDRFAVMLWNHVDDDGKEIPPPQPIPPPQGSPASLQGMQDAERQVMMISGQFQAQMGENDTQSAASGKAIGERKQQGDTATYHFVEHFGDMLRAIGIQLLDLYPKIYDTKRALHVFGDDGAKTWIMIDPDMQEAAQELEKEREDEEAVRIAFNPKLGEYECVSDPGPDSATKRQEAWQAYSQIIMANKELIGVIGDLVFNYGDFPGADDIRERLKKEIKAQKPYLFDKDVSPEFLQAQQSLQRLTALNAELVQKLALKEIALKGKSELRDIEATRAENERMKVQIEALARLTLTPQQREQMQHELEVLNHGTALQMVVDANAAEIDSQANPTGAPT